MSEQLPSLNGLIFYRLLPKTIENIGSAVYFCTYSHWLLPKTEVVEKFYKSTSENLTV